MADYKITEGEMLRLVEEITKLDVERNEQLTEPQVERILSDLNLPADLIGEALDRLEQRKKLQQQRRVIIRGTALSALIGLFVVMVVLFLFQTGSLTKLQMPAILPAIETPGSTVFKADDLTGPWSGADFGQVELRKQDTGYQGTYSDTWDISKLGQIQLTRISANEFSGSWWEESQRYKGILKAKVNNGNELEVFWMPKDGKRPETWHQTTLVRPKH